MVCIEIISYDKGCLRFLARLRNVSYNNLSGHVNGTPCRIVKISNNKVTSPLIKWGFLRLSLAYIKTMIYAMFPGWGNVTSSPNGARPDGWLRKVGEKIYIFYDRKCITAIGAQILVMAGFFFTFLLKKRNPFLNEGMSMNMTRTANCHATKGYWI